MMEDGETWLSTLAQQSTCANCGSVVEVPVIRCIACNPSISICKSCFAMGAEFGSHENDHPYTVVKYDFSIFDSKWTAAEELRLLDAIIENGFGNWPAISGRVRTKTPADCENHYLRCYVENPEAPLPEFPDNYVMDGGAPIIFKLCDNPPRPAEGSPLWSDMGGYSAARGDFNIEFDNFAEMDICRMTFSEDEDDDDDVDDDDSEEEKEKENVDEEEKRLLEEEKGRMKELYTDMKFSALEVYRNSLKERQWRKGVVRKYGLINIRRWYGMFKRRYERSISLEFFRPFMRLFPPMTFDKYLESLLFEKQLKSEIVKLQEYRRNGLTRLGSIRTFHLLRHRRDMTRSKRHLMQDVLNHIKDEVSAQTWLARQAALDSNNPAGATNAAFPPTRRVTPRLHIEGMPGYDQLSHLERELCSDVRLVPKAYLDFSRILIAECSKHGSLRLAQARTLIKIDVNKTRKLYDFLILHGHINKDPI